MAQFTIYRSTDAGSPVLNGLTGSLITVLDAVLVNGYGTQTAAGWTKPYSASGNTSASYKQGISSSGMYMWVQDSGSVASGKEAIFRGFETMSSANTSSGTYGPFPTNAQSALTNNGLVARKSSGSNATSVPWIAVADTKTLYFFAQTGDLASTYLTFGFGDITSFVANDKYECAIFGRFTENVATNAPEALSAIYGNPTATAGNYICRGYTGLAGSVNIGKVADAAKCGFYNTAYSPGNGNLQFPNYPNGGFYMAPIFITDTITAGVTSVRGKLRGLWASCHGISTVTDGDAITNIGTTNISTLVIKTIQAPSAATGYFLVETSNTLD